MPRLLPRRLARRHPGLYRASVVDATDPEDRDRVQVSLPSLSGSPSAWAPTLRDLGPRPQVGDEVLVGFEAGALDSPYVVGVLSTGPAATGPVALNAGDVQFSGLVKCSTLIADSVIATSYSPGAGNIF